MKNFHILQGIVGLLLLIYSSCQAVEQEQSKEEASKVPTTNSLVVLGNVQDAGYPQIGCMKSCCKNVWDSTIVPKQVTSLGIVSPHTKKTWLFEASPDFKTQTKTLSDYAGNESIQMPDGVFLTHGHIGHYTGLMHLGREAMGANQVPVYAMPKMREYLSSSGPWSQLVELKNITLHTLVADSAISLSSEITVTPFLVPHRGEYTETVGYKIEGSKHSAIFIPDIDKWNKWDRNINDEIAKVDYAFLDATFFKNGEVGNRDMSEIPHPFVEESMQRFDSLPDEERNKVYFIHMNHTNPLLQENSAAQQEVLAKGYHIAEEGLLIEL